jgi:carboxyl-terminal processing protease
MDEIATIDGIPVATAVESRIGRSPRAVDDRARSWALRVALAGKRNAPREIGVSRPGGARLVRVLPLQNTREGEGLLAVKTLPSGVGYIRIADSLGETDLIREFDSALARFQNTSALILDLRTSRAAVTRQSRAASSAVSSPGVTVPAAFSLARSA